MPDRPLESLDLASLRSRPRRRTTIGHGVVATPCGRNLVWQLDLGGGEQVFVTCCRDADDFSRRLFGLTVAHELARANRRFMAAEIVFADPQSLTIATRQIGGVSLGRVLVRAFRHDQNPLDIWRRRASARRHLDLALTWLSAFQNAQGLRPAALYDHSAAAAWARSCRRLASDVFSSHPHLQAIPTAFALRSSASDGLLVMGDATPANFYVDGAKVGAVDFEDVGVGAGWRDAAQLSAAIRWTLSQPLYAADATLDAWLQARRTSLHAVTELELLVNRFVAAAAGVRLRGLRRLGIAIDRTVTELVASGEVVRLEGGAERR